MEARRPSAALATVPLLLLVLCGLMSALKWKAGMHVPLVVGIVGAGLVGACLRLPWKEMERGLVEGTSRALQALFILILVGTITAGWTQGGIIPTIVYYGLELITPAVFLPVACLIAALVSVATGTSFGCLATLGVALMAVGQGLGLPAPAVAGALISGAYFGDKLSPLSDTTNLAPAMAGCTLFEHVGHMMYDTIPGLILSLAGYLVLGLRFTGAQGAADMSTISAMLDGLAKNFHVSPLLLLVPVVTIVVAVKRVPAIPSLALASLLGVLSALVFQRASLASVVKVLSSGYVAKTGVSQLDKLLTTGGIVSMGNTIILLSLATALGGILEKTGVLAVLLDAIKSRVRTNAQLMLATLGSSLAVGYATGAQLLAIILPARMFAPLYRARGLHPKNLSRAVEAAGTVGINLVPWSVPAIFAQSVLKVPPAEFIPYVFLAYAVILLNALYGITGVTIAKVRATSERQPAE